MDKQHNTSVWSKSLNWLANHTYRQIPALIGSYAIKSSQSQCLCFEDYIRSPHLAREAGLMCIRQMKSDFIKRKEGIQKVIDEFKSRDHIQPQKPHELLCPICLDIMNGPISTSCSHAFCLMCIDEAILFSPTCPVCRKQIRGEELIVSKSIENIIRTFLAKFQLQEVEKFVNKETQYEDWLKKRSFNKWQIVIGDCIDVRDTEFIWCRATIKDIFPKDCESKADRQSILVHYEGWAPVFDEVISLNSQRLAQSKFYTSRIEIPHYNLSADNAQHLRSPVVIGQQFVPQLRPPSSASDLSLVQLSLFQVRSQSEESSINSSIHNSFTENSELRSYSQLSMPPQMNFNNILRWEQEIHPLPNLLDQFIDIQGTEQLMDDQSIRPLSLSHLAPFGYNGFDHSLSFNRYRERSLPQQRILSQLIDVAYNDQHQAQCEGIQVQQNSIDQDSSMETPVFDFVDSMELYYESRNGDKKSKLIGRGRFNRMFRNESSSEEDDGNNEENGVKVERRQQSDESALQSVSDQQHFDSILKSQESNEEQKPHFGYKQMQENFTDYQLQDCIHDQPIPFITDIEQIHHKRIKTELKQLEIAHEQMRLKIESQEKGVKSSMQKWNKLNQLLQNYFGQDQNPQSCNEDDILLFNKQTQNIELNCFNRKTSHTAQQAHLLQEMCEQQVD